MPSVIAIEAKPLEFEDIDSGFFHLYLVKTQTDASGRVISEKVIRGSLEGFDDLGTIAGANLASSPDRRGSDTPAERHRTVLDLGTRNADDVWKVMVQHAVNIDRADLRYSVDIGQADLRRRPEQQFRHRVGASHRRAERGRESPGRRQPLGGPALRPASIHEGGRYAIGNGEP